jgi:hypothetical protein
MTEASDGRFKKLVIFDRAEKRDLAWLVEHGFGKNPSDTIRKAVAHVRLTMEASG